MQEMGIESSLTDDILSGKKTIEGRLGKPKFLKIQDGDVVSIRRDIWQNNEIVKSYPDATRIYVDQVLYFESFKEMLSALDYREIVPSAKSPNDVLKIYNKIYTAEDEQEFGVVAILFELV